MEKQVYSYETKLKATQDEVGKCDSEWNGEVCGIKNNTQIY